MAVLLNTEDKLEYNFMIAAINRIQFRVKAPNDAHIALTTASREIDPMYEIFIGGWGNTKSVIRKNRTKPDVAEADTPGILSNDEHRGFWITWKDGHLTVGKEGEEEPFLSYTDPQPFVISNFGLCTGWGACGDWIVEDVFPEPTAPSKIQIGKEYWADAVGNNVPPGGTAGGVDKDNEMLYIGRAEHEGALIPGKINMNHGVCYIPWGGLEHAKTNYQILCNCNPVWVRGSGPDTPVNAIPGGETETGEVLYIGRAPHMGTITIGKVQPSHNVLYIPFNGEEVAIEDYEVLVNDV